MKMMKIFQLIKYSNKNIIQMKRIFLFSHLIIGKETLKRKMKIEAKSSNKGPSP